jgi:hypothetical protein
MSKLTIEELVQRLEHLERETCRWKVMGITTVIVFCLLLVIGATPGESVRVWDEVQARRFVLLDDHGNTWAELRLEAPNVQIVDKETRRLVIGKRPIFSLYDGDGKRLVNLDGHTGLELYDKTGETRARLGLRGDIPFLNLSHENGEASLSLLDGPRLTITDKSAKTGGHLSLYQGIPRLQFTDKEGKSRIMIGVKTDGAPAVELYDEGEKTRATLGSASLESSRAGTVEKRSESSLVLFNKDGNVIWSAP